MDQCSGRFGIKYALAFRLNIICETLVNQNFHNRQSRPNLTVWYDKSDPLYTVGGIYKIFGSILNEGLCLKIHRNRLVYNKTI